MQISETEKPLTQEQFPPALFPALLCENLCPWSSSSEQQNVIHFQSPAIPSPASFTFLSDISSPMQSATLTGGSEKIKSEDKDALSPHLSILSHDPEETACSNFSSDPSRAPIPSPNLDHTCCASIGMSDSEWTEVAFHENSLSADGLSFLLPSYPYLPPDAAPDRHSPSFLASPPLIQSLSQSPDPLTNTNKKEEETPSSLSFLLDKDIPLAPPSLILDSSKFQDGCATLLCLSPNCSSPVCQSTVPSQSHDADGLVDDDNIDCTSASPIHNIIHVKMDHLPLNSEDTLKMNRKGDVEHERHTDTVQTQEAVVYNSDTVSSAGLSGGSRLVSNKVCNQTKIDPQVLFCSLHKLSTETKPEELGKVCQMEINGTDSESLSSLVLNDGLPEVQSTTEVEPNDLIEIDSLDVVFQTSVDGSESENGDVDAFFQQLETEGRVYWAEPIQVSNPTSVLEESNSFEASHGSPGKLSFTKRSDSFSSTGRAIPSSVSPSTTMETDQTSRKATASPDSPSSLILPPFPCPSTIPDLKPSSRSVSVQMSSSLSSHIVHRKDIPYMTASKCSHLPAVLPLDTSTPFRAVQSWTDRQIQQNTLNKQLSHGALRTVANKVTVSASASEIEKRRTLIFSSSPSFPLLSNDGQSHDCLPGMARNCHTVSASMDKGLVFDEEEEVDRKGNEDEKHLWEGNQTSTVACYCACDHQCSRCTQKSYNKQHTLGNTPVSNTARSILCPYFTLSIQSSTKIMSNIDSFPMYHLLLVIQLSHRSVRSQC